MSQWTLFTPSELKMEQKRRVSCPEEANSGHEKRSNIVCMGRPNKSYSNIITEILRESTHQRLFLSEIYKEILARYPYFATAGNSWKNSVRHNLSQNPIFEKIPTLGRCNMWGLSTNYDYRFINGRLVNVNKSSVETQRRFSIPEVRNLIEVTSNPKLILPRIRRPMPDYIRSDFFQEEVCLEAPSWLDATSDDSNALVTSSSELPLKVEQFRRIDKELEVTPPTLLPKIPIYPFFTQTQSNANHPQLQASDCRKKLRRNSDPLLSSPGWLFPVFPK